MGRVARSIAEFAIATALSTAVVAGSASAQGTLNDTIASRAQRGQQGGDRLLVEAKELVYDNDRNTVAARGDVELNYQGRTLQADRVTYDRGNGRVYAEGNARLTQSDGTVVTGERFELTDDFRSGFIDSLRVTQPTVEQGQPVTARFSAPRAERIEGETTVFERGTYTACEPCAKDPTRPPLWQVKAARIIANNSERTIYYENATFEFAGVPIAYVPYFWTPDPTVKRKTGFLAPSYIASNTLGTGVTVPFFINLAPNYDLTLRPSYYSRQGFLGQAEWRHRLETGSYNIRAAGIFPQEKDAFLPAPLGAREKEFRGSIETTGRFFINDRWTWGWDIALLSDKWFLQNFRIRSESLSNTYLRESISTLYLTGQGDRSWFDLRGYYFKGLSSADWQKQQPVVHPVLDYNKRFDGPAAIGGEVAVDVNLTSLTREASQFVPLAGNLGYTFPAYTTSRGSTVSIYETCLVFDRGRCLVRGLSGTQTRLSAQVSWRRQLIDDIGQVWTPFTYARADGFAVSPSLNDYQNPQLRNFGISGGEEAIIRGMAAAGLEYRFPLVADLGSWGTQIIEPIGQIIARPSESRIGRLPNEDAQSLVFDDTNIFEWDKFSGYDRVEGGVRANVGAKYSVTGANGFYADALVGQSYQLAGVNSYRPGDLVNVGRDSGLESRASDLVGRIHVQPNKAISFTTRGRFDETDLSLKRLEANVSGTFGPLTASMTYARYMAQPELGFDQRREGLLSSLVYNITPNWFVTGSALVDFDRYLTDRELFVTQYAASPESAIYRRSDHWTFGSVSLGAGYRDECTTFSVTYISALKDAIAYGEKERSQTVLVRLELRTLGQASVSQNLDESGSSQNGTAR